MIISLIPNFQGLNNFLLIINYAIKNWIFYTEYIKLCPILFNKTLVEEVMRYEERFFEGIVSGFKCRFRILKGEYVNEKR